MAQLVHKDAPIGTENGASKVMVAVMGATGTGKSTFIHLLTNDPNIIIGHEPDSETVDINTAHYIDPQSGLSVTLVDTPGFDDSRDGVGDVDILEKIAKFLQADGGRKLNGIIYMHRISDPRLGGVSKKNLRMFAKLCNKELGNVRIVTTNWGRVSEKEGRDREAALAKGAFKPLVDAGAVLVRQENLESARSIMSQLIYKNAVKMQIQEELDAGTALIATGAGAVINEELKAVMIKHKNEMAALKEEMEEAAREKDEALRAELAEERRTLENKLARAEEDWKRLESMVVEERSKFDKEMRKAERRNTEMQTQLQEMQQKTEAEATEIRKSTEKITQQMKRADEERARLAAERGNAKAKAEQERSRLAAEGESSRRKAELERAELERAELERQQRQRQEKLRRAEEAREKQKAEEAEKLLSAREETGLATTLRYFGRFFW